MCWNELDLFQLAAETQHNMCEKNTRELNTRRKRESVVSVRV